MFIMFITLLNKITIPLDSVFRFGFLFFFFYSFFLKWFSSLPRPSNSLVTLSLIQTAYLCIEDLFFLFTTLRNSRRPADTRHLFFVSIYICIYRFFSFC